MTPAGPQLRLQNKKEREKKMYSSSFQVRPKKKERKRKTGFASVYHINTIIFLPGIQGGLKTLHKYLFLIILSVPLGGTLVV